MAPLVAKMTNLLELRLNCEWFVWAAAWGERHRSKRSSSLRQW